MIAFPLILIVILVLPQQLLSILLLALAAYSLSINTLLIIYKNILEQQILNTILL